MTAIRTVAEVLHSSGAIGIAMELVLAADERTPSGAKGAGGAARVAASATASAASRLDTKDNCADGAGRACMPCSR